MYEIVYGKKKLVQAYIPIPYFIHSGASLHY
jgi:hypothetical protein